MRVSAFLIAVCVMALASATRAPAKVNELQHLLDNLRAAGRSR
jgi:hypothetical protein